MFIALLHRYAVTCHVGGHIHATRTYITSHSHYGVSYHPGLILKLNRGPTASYEFRGKGP